MTKENEKKKWIEFKNPKTGKKVGYICGDKYVSERKNEHYFRKYDGFGVSEAVLEELKKKEIKKLIIPYKDEATETMYMGTTDLFEKADIYENIDNDKQRIVPKNQLKEMKKEDKQKNEISEEEIKALEATPIKLYNLNNDVHKGKMYYGFRVLIEDKMEDFLVFEDGTVKKASDMEGTCRSNLNFEEIQMSNQCIAKMIKKEMIPMDKYQLYRKIRRAFEDYLEMKEEIYYDLLTLWVMHTYLLNQFKVTPYIHLIGFQDSGKTAIMSVCKRFCFKSLMTMPSSSVIFRSLERSQNTLFIDEFENYEEKPDLIEILNRGYQIDGVVSRCDEKDYNIRRDFRVFGAKMFATVKKQYIGTFESRCMEISTIPKRDGNKLKPIENIDDEEQLFSELRDNLYLFALNNYKKIMKDYKDLEVEGLNNRKLQLIKPLLAIAKVFGKDQEIIRYYKQEILRKLENSIENDKGLKLLKVLYEEAKGIMHTMRVAEITRLFNSTMSNESHVNEKFIGSILSNLGLQRNKKRTSNGYVIDISRMDIIEAINRKGYTKDMFLQVINQQTDEHNEHNEHSELDNNTQEWLNELGVV